MQQVPSLCMLCTAVLCNCALDVLTHAADVLPLLPGFSKAALLAVLRRRLCRDSCREMADAAVSLLSDAGATREAGGALNLAGCACTDAGVRTLINTRVASWLTALDVRRCGGISGALKHRHLSRIQALTILVPDRGCASRPIACGTFAHYAARRVCGKRLCSFA